MRKRGRVPLTLADGSKPCNRRTCWVDTDFTAVEHTEAKDVTILNRTSTNNFRKETEANTHQLASFAGLKIFDSLRLFSAQPIVVNRLERLVPCCVIVAAVVFPAQSRFVGELLFLDKIDPSQFSRVHVQLDSEDLDHALDEIHGFGHSE